LDRFLTVGEVAALLRRSTETIRRRIAQGCYPGTFLDGREWRVPASDVEAEIAARRVDVVRPESARLTKAQEIARRILSEVA
jgi:excisionase family DNA binding protein